MLPVRPVTFKKTVGVGTLTLPKFGTSTVNPASVATSTTYPVAPVTCIQFATKELDVIFAADVAIGAPTGTIVVTVNGVLFSLRPLAFTARTRQKYVVPAVKPVTVKLVLTVFVLLRIAIPLKPCAVLTSSS